jgi:hypothetical protein
MRITRDPWYGSSLAALCVILAAGGLFLATRSSDGDVAPDAIVNVTATVVSTPAAAASPTPVPDPVTFDYARALDLLKVGKALDAYYEQHGTYPDSEGEVTTLCDETGDPGCVLTTVMIDVPFDDGNDPYWYLSDGSTFTLVARSALSQEDTTACPADLPPAITGVPVMCAAGTGDR